MESRNAKLQVRMILLNAALMASAPAFSGDPITVVARDTIKTESFTPVYQDDERGRLVYRATNRSILKETTKSGLLNGLTKSCDVQADLTHGSGPMRGYCRHEAGPTDLALVEWSGMCHTSNGGDGKPQTRCWGGWIYIPGGQGRLAATRGGGTWSGFVAATGEFEEEITGLVRP